MRSVVCYDARLSYERKRKTRHMNKLCVATPWSFQRIDRYWPYCIHSDHGWRNLLQSGGGQKCTS